jgi:hypothetical protein
VPALVYILVSIALALLAPWRAEPITGYRTGSEPQRCQPPSQPKRTFVGFPDGESSLSDYEPAALQATRVMKATQDQSCGLGELQDSGGRLRTALGTGRLEIARVMFRQDDLRIAEVHLQQRGGVGAAGGRSPEAGWTLRVVSDGKDSWQVVSAARR